MIALTYHELTERLRWVLVASCRDTGLALQPAHFEIHVSRKDLAEVKKTLPPYASPDNFGVIRVHEFALVADDDQETGQPLLRCAWEAKL